MDLRKCLTVCAQKLSLGLVWKELQVFSKLIYRGRNQHRRDKCYQRLTRVRINHMNLLYIDSLIDSILSVHCVQVAKELRVYQTVALANCVKKLAKLLLRCVVFSS